MKILPVENIIDRFKKKDSGALLILKEAIENREGYNSALLNFQKKGCFSLGSMRRLRGSLKKATKSNAAQAYDMIEHLLEQSLYKKELGLLFFEQLFEAFLINQRDESDQKGFNSMRLCEKGCDLVKKYEAKLGSVPPILFAKAVIAHIKGQRYESYKLFKAASKPYKGYELPGFQAGAYTVLNPESTIILSLKKEKNLCWSEIQSVIPINDKTANNTFIICCDELYFAAHYKETLESLFKYTKNACICYHIINPTGEAEEGLQEWQKDHPDCSNYVGMTSSTYYGNETHLRTFYATCRFLLVSDFIKFHGTRIFTYDADIVFDKSLDRFLKRFESEDFDIGLNRNKGVNARFPWTTVNANCLALSQSQAAQDFAKYLQCLGNNTFPRKRDIPSWWYDQNLLYNAASTSFFLIPEIKAMDNMVTGNGKRTNKKHKKGLRR